MKVRFLKLKNWLLISLMGTLGLGGCQCHKKLAAPTTPDPKPETPAVRDRGEAQLMYGVPTMNYMIRGQVKDSMGRPVKDIRVNMLERGMETKDGELQGDPERVKAWLEKSAVTTDKKGYFELKDSGLPQEQVRLLVRDVDGKENRGEFKNRVVEVEVTPDNVDRTNAGGWNEGTFNKELNIKLEKK